MIALFLLLVIVAMVLGIVGVVAKGLLYLLFIGIVVFLGALLLGALRMRRRPGRGRQVGKLSPSRRAACPPGGSVRADVKDAEPGFLPLSGLDQGRNGHPVWLGGFPDADPRRRVVRHRRRARA
jgi:hypothetical protein